MPVKSCMARKRSKATGIASGKLDTLPTVEKLEMAQAVDATGKNKDDPMIAIHFKNESDSPNGKLRMRITWKQRDNGELFLVYRHSMVMTKYDWADWRKCGAVLAVDTRQESLIVRTTLGIHLDEIRMGHS